MEGTAKEIWKVAHNLSAKEIWKVAHNLYEIQQMVKKWDDKENF